VKAARQSTSPVVDGILLLYHRPLAPGALTLGEHVGAFPRHSRFPVWAVNTELGFPVGLDSLRFSAIVLHFSLFGTADYKLDERFLDYLGRSRDHAYKVAFFQDEHRFCGRRFAFLNDHDVDCVYTCLEPSESEEVYRRHTGVRELRTTLPGLVSEQLAESAERLAFAGAERSIDVGYRGRSLEPYMGRGALEKHEIGVRFKQLAADRGLVMDIQSGEADRIYGEDWYRFVGRCTSVLGTESGVSIFDLQDEVYPAYQEAVRDPTPANEERFRTVAEAWEDRIYYRTISPRQFEAAALGTCQILFRGRYSGVMAPRVHYIALEKDFSNLDEVLALHRDRAVREELVANARRDLVDSGDYSYAGLVKGFDDLLVEQGLAPDVSDDVRSRVDAALARGQWRRTARARVSHAGARVRSAEWRGGPLVRAAYRRVRPRRVVGHGA
jgi:hypothetical protein